MSRSWRPTAALAGAAALTLLAFFLRVRGMGQSLFGDEVLTYEIIRRDSLPEVLRALRAAPESTPPLHYVLAWAAGKLSPALTDVRLPSLVAGTALVPVVLALGRRLLSERAAWLAAAALALSPFATFYATETRAYALVTFACALSLLCLLRALERPTLFRWALFWLAATVAVYSHYTAALVLGVQFVWALATRPDRRRAVLLAHAAVTLAYVPWLPFLEGKELLLIPLTYPLSVSSWLEALVRMLVGTPFSALDALPGTVALVLAALALALGLAALAAAASRRHLRAPPRDLLLVLGLALACPAGLLAYYAVSGTDLINPRNFSVSLPGLVLLVAALLTSSRAAVGWVVPAGLAVIVLVVGAVRQQEPDAARPATAAVAAVIDARAAPGEPVVESPLFLTRRGRLGASFALNLRRPHRVFGITTYRSRDGVHVPIADPRAWRGHARVWVLGPELPGSLVLPPAPPGWRRLEHRRYPGLTPYGLELYRAP